MVAPARGDVSAPAFGAPSPRALTRPGRSRLRVTHTSGPKCTCSKIKKVDNIKRIKKVTNLVFAKQCVFFKSILINIFCDFKHGIFFKYSMHVPRLPIYSPPPGNLCGPYNFVHRKASCLPNRIRITQRSESAQRPGHGHGSFSAG
jgi:hypothetical protein